MTFSIAARCAETGMFGVAVSSSSPAVAARCAYVRAGVGAVLSQNITDPRLGVRLLDLMGLGATAEDAVSIVRGSAAHVEYRQLLAVDAAGPAAVFSGSEALGNRGEATGPGVADMKAGLVMNTFVFEALARFGAARHPVTVLYTLDEEIASPLYVIV